MQHVIPTRKEVFRYPGSLLATWFGSGLIRVAPGTMGSLAAMVCAVPFHFLGSLPLMFGSLMLFVAGIPICNVYMRRHGREHDPKEVVIDEVAGMWLVLSIMPMDVFSYLVAFAAFRFFDIVKPWPISLADRKITGGFGVMFDDFLAAVFAIVILILGMRAFDYV